MIIAPPLHQTLHKQFVFDGVAQEEEGSLPIVDLIVATLASAV